MHRHPTDPKTFVMQDVLELLSALSHMPDVSLPSLDRLTVHDLTTLKYCLDMATSRLEKAKEGSAFLEAASRASGHRL